MRKYLIPIVAIGLLIGALFICGVWETTDTKALTLSGTTSQRLVQLQQAVTKLETQVAALTKRVAELEGPTTTLPVTTTTAKPTTTTAAPTTTTQAPTTTTTIPPLVTGFDPTDGSWLSVRDYGAKGDGVTDDRAAIQAVIDTAVKQHKNIYFPAGTYRVVPRSGTTLLPSCLDLKAAFGAGTYTRYYGAGEGQTIIRADGGANYTRILRGVQQDYIDLRYLTIDGNSDSCDVQEPSAEGEYEQRHDIFCDGCDYWTIEDVTVTRPQGDGVFLWNGSTGCQVRKVTATRGDVAIHPNARVGINVQGADHALIEGCVVEGYSNAFKSELDDGDPDSVGVTIRNCVGNALQLSMRDAGITARHVDYLVEGNTFTGSPQTMNLDRCHGLIVRNNRFTGDGDAWSVGIHARWDNQDVEITGNRFEGYSYSDIYLNNLYDWGASKGIRISGNTFVGAERRMGHIMHASATVTGVEVGTNSYPAGNTLYNGAAR